MSLSEWPNKVKTMQKNWIGKSFGCEIDFKIEGDLPVKNIKCFTTRPDTLFGFSFFALSVDHPLSKHFEKIQNFKNLKNECSKTGTTEESIAQAEKIGFKTNLQALKSYGSKNKSSSIFCKFCTNGLWFWSSFWMSSS